jgi:mono/diheme cytochrome c family protein
LAALLLVSSGCEQAPAPDFRLNMVQMVNNETSAEYQQEIADVMAALFGTPDEPFAMAETGLDQLRLDLAAGAAWSDQAGVDRGLYRKHCVHCHGISGDGRGPTGLFLNPYPRDYRMGVFKFKSTYNNAKPTDDDLHRVLYNGIPGTSMPSFSLLPSSEREALVEYVKYLAMRGEMETRLAEYVFNELGEEEEEGEDGEVKLVRLPLNPNDDAEQAEVITEMLADVVAPWEEAVENVIVPEEGEIPQDDRSAEEIAQAVQRGRELFYGVKANCVKCHGPTGLGDGQRNDYDIWSKQNVEFTAATDQLASSITEQSQAEDLDDRDRERLAARRDLLDTREEVEQTLYPPRNAIPRNLRQGIYRGGRRRLDVFWRIHAGIPGSPMPGVGATAPGGQGTISEAEMWDIVDYVLSLPYEPASNAQKALAVNPESIIN